MKQTRIILSIVSMFLGIIIISISKIVEEFVIKLGRVAYQAAAAGSYNPQDYEINLTINYWLGSFCIIFGLIFLFKESIPKYFSEVRESSEP